MLAPPAAMRSRSFTTSAPDGVTLHTLRHGDPAGPALVLLHGGGANAHWWDAVAPRLAERFHVVALDFRGHGDSDRPGKRNPGDFQRDLEALLEHLGAPDAVLVGHSMGAHVALAHAAAPGPSRGPRAVVAVEVARGGGSRERRRMRLALLAARSHPTRAAAVERFRLLPPSPHASEAVRRRLAEHSVAELPDGRFGYKFDPRWFGVPPAPRPDLARVGAPTLVVRGAESGLLSPEGAAELARELPDARVVEIAGAGHNVHVERPEAFLDAVLPFLAERA